MKTGCLTLVLLARLIVLSVCGGMLSSCGKQGSLDYSPPEGISWVSVLSNATDISMIAAPVDPSEYSLHFSSAADPKKVMLSNLAPEVMGDMDHGFFLDMVDHAGYVDVTLAEVRDCGMISWIWSANPSGTLLLFIDDDVTPAIQMSFKDFISGQFLPVKYPFASRTAGGYNLHFPILHAHYCKVVLRVPSKKALASLYYQIAWNSITPSQKVNSFSIEDVSRGTALLSAMAKAWQFAPRAESSDCLARVEIQPGQIADLYASVAESGTITNIFLKAERRSDLAELHFIAQWDEHEIPDVDCPLHLLAGTSDRMNEVVSFAAWVRDSELSIRWPMPYKKARISLRNNSTKTLRLTYRVGISSQTSRMRFVGKYQKIEGLKTDCENVLSLADVFGEGCIVACNIQVKSQTEKWWGEGDTLIYLDSMGSPTWRGTGTEDYFGFAWCSTQLFNHPVRGQSDVFEARTGRTSSMYRYHILDRLPFHYQAVFKTEVWGQASGFMDYESLILYYFSAVP